MRGGQGGARGAEGCTRVCGVYEASDQDDQHELCFLRFLKLARPYRAPYHDGKHERHGLQCGGLADEQRLEHILANHAEEAGHEEGARDLHGMCMVCAWSVHGLCMACAWHVHGLCMVCAWLCLVCARPDPAQAGRPGDLTLTTLACAGWAVR